jgi:hypothetical protein
VEVRANDSSLEGVVVSGNIHEYRRVSNECIEVNVEYVKSK